MAFLFEKTRLPMVLPHSVELLRTLGDDNIALGRLASIVGLDPVLSAKLLRLANAPFFGMSSRIHAVEDALMIIGLSNTRAYVQTEILLSLTELPPWDKIDLLQFWQDAIWIASAASVLANRSASSPSLAFSAGLFHNFGRLVLLAQHPGTYNGTFAQAWTGSDLAKHEVQQFHVDHGQLGAEVLKHWNLPQALVEAVQGQYQGHSQEQGGFNRNPIVTTLQGAHVLYALLGPTQSTAPPLAQESTTQDTDDTQAPQLLEALQALGFQLTPDNLNGVCNSIELKFKNMMKMIDHGHKGTTH